MNEKQEVILCGRCNRKLVDQKSIDRGYGPVCYRKVQEEDARRELERHDLLEVAYNQ